MTTHSTLSYSLIKRLPLRAYLHARLPDYSKYLEHISYPSPYVSGGNSCFACSGLPVVIATVIALLTFAFLFSQWHSYCDPLSDIPGPILARWTPMWLAYQARMGRRYIAVDKLHKKYGKIVRISPNHVSVADKDAVSIIYGQGNGAFHKSDFYNAFVCDKASVFSTTNRQDHAQKRRLVSQAFSQKSMQQCSHLIHDVLNVFVGKLDEMCSSGKEVDALLWFNYLAFDVLSDLAFGEAIGMVSRGSDAVAVQRPDGSMAEQHAIALVDEREHLAAVIGIHPAFNFISKFIPDPFFIHGHKSSNGIVDLARRRVMKRINSAAQRDDILNKLITARTQDKNSLTSEQISELTAEAVTLLIAGSDTTSNSLTAIIHLVLTHPHVHSKLIALLEERVDDDIPTHDMVKDISYLDAVIDEGLRYHATTAIGLHRSVPEGGAICMGRYFPPGTEMSVPAWTLQHDPSIWGDPEHFRPERWLESRDLKSYLLAFGKGPRACLGRNLAYMEMRLVLSTVLLRYNIQLTSPILETTEGFMHKPLKMMVTFQHRKR
ncbi:benzoate para-hydroxylase [Infundibulicybe gibba]|nr:benzoate para-hydroxylase [Infundibulicybe gibba]